MYIFKMFYPRFWVLLSFLYPSLLFGKVTYLQDKESELQEIREMIRGIESGLNQLRSKSEKVEKLEPTLLKTGSLKRVSASEILKLHRIKKKAMGKNTHPNPFQRENKLKGFYILPFVGIQSSTDVEYRALGGPVEIGLKNGLSTGLRLGYNWYDLFAEFQFSYQRNDLKSINPSFNIVGGIEGLGFHLSSGGRINFNESFSGIAGIGVGGIRQELNLSWSGYPIGDTDFLFSSNVLLGLEFRPIDHLVLGLRYRWILIDNMDLFSKRYLSSFELTAGYLF